ncbi:MAG: alpha/beta hydrolase [Rhodospirillaceae bacterium]|nr:MAG: alpha/beta hydrolase [Rhodospirillaceae bacterium]
MADAAGSVRFLNMEIDVTAAAALGENVHTQVTVALPKSSDLPATPIVCFALPGAGFSRGYFTFDMPGSHDGGQAGWHAHRGWIFVAIDHLGVGESSLPDPVKLLYNNVSAANHATVQEVLMRLASGTFAQDFPVIKNPVVLGIGQSMGGCLTVVQQARHNSFDGIGVLGYSAIYTRSSTLPGTPRGQNTFVTRDTFPSGPDFMSRENRLAAAVNATLLQFEKDRAKYWSATPTPVGWSYHFDDEPAEIVKWDMDAAGNLPAWRSATMPGLVYWVTAPGTIAAEAASITVPVLAAFGERDVLDDPRLECKAYRNAVDFSMFICPRMAHMHNFASTREVFWSRIEKWGEHVAELKRRLPDNWPSQLFSDSY